jgi:formyltetrahydrofolate synthetase
MFSDLAMAQTAHRTPALKVVPNKVQILQDAIQTDGWFKKTQLGHAFMLQDRCTENPLLVTAISHTPLVERKTAMIGRWVETLNQTYKHAMFYCQPFSSSVFDMRSAGADDGYRLCGDCVQPYQHHSKHACSSRDIAIDDAKAREISDLFRLD